MFFMTVFHLILFKNIFLKAKRIVKLVFLHGESYKDVALSLEYLMLSCFVVEQ